MALPPWTVELLRRGVTDLARQVTDNETAASLKEQASKLVEELPKTARDKVDTILRQAEQSARPLKDVWQSGALWRGGAVSITPTRLINATGCLLDPRGSGVGLPSEAIAAAIPHLSGDAARVENVDTRLCEAIAAAVARRCDDGNAETRDLDAIVTNSLDASLGLIATLGKRGGSISVPRCCAQPMSVSAGEEPTSGPGQLLVDRLRTHGCSRVREFGLADGSDVSSEHHFQTRSPIGSGRPRHASHEGRVADPLPRRRSNYLVRLASEQTTPQIPADSREDWIDIVVVPYGGVFKMAAPVEIQSIVGHLQAGADVVVLAGGVLAGTPEIGLIVGDNETIQKLRETPAADLAAAPTALTSLVASSVTLQSSGNSPLQQLLDVSEDNLQDRATRLSTQLAGFDVVTATRVTSDPATFGLPQKNATDNVIASRQVIVTLDASKPADRVARQLAEATTGVLCRVNGNEIIIDLRWVSPEQQAQIGEILGTTLS